MKSHELEQEVALFALRYSLNQPIFAINVMYQYLSTHKNSLSRLTKELMIREIQEALNLKKVDSFDVLRWYDIMNLLEDSMVIK